MLQKVFRYVLKPGETALKINSHPLKLIHYFVYILIPVTFCSMFTIGNLFIYLLMIQESITGTKPMDI
jgi:hypothetical protein